MAEAGARIAFAWLRDQQSFRARRPLLRYGRDTARFYALAAVQPTVETDLDGLRVVVSTADRTIGRSVYTSGDWDPLMIGMLFAALDEYRQPYRGTTLLEVGANFGVYVLPAVTRHGFGSAVAYEPDPGSFALLERNIELNKLGPRIAAHNVALSAAPGELTLRLGTYNAGDNRIVSDDATVGRSTTVRIQARTFDAEVDAGRIPLDRLGLALMDVQGHELEVLHGARGLLAARVPLVIEYATAMTDPTARQELDELLAASYAVMVDLGWCALTNRLRFQPARAVRNLAANGRAVETDLLFLPGR